MAEVVFKSNLFISNPCRLQHGHQNVSMSLKFSDPSNRVLIRSSSSSSSSKGALIRSISSSSRNSQFYGPRINLIQQSTKRGNPQASNSQMMSICIGKAQKWWEKGIQPNMKEITSAQHLVDSLSNSGDQLVVLAFFSPGCGGCKALHPKLCQLAEMNPEVQFLHVNYEEHKSMCYSLNVHVLPFFRFYRGAHGRLCSFSCTNATIKKFKDALAKHSTDRCSLGPAKGLEEKELIALSANKDLSFSYTPKPVVESVPIEEKILAQSKTMQDKTLVTAGR